MGEANRLPDIFTVNEAAQYLRVHRDTVIRWADSGHLPCSFTPGGRRRFTRADLDAALQREPVAS